MGWVASSPGQRWVYFADRDGLVKIGYSADPVRRVDQLGARLMAVMPGGRRTERRMHGLFAEYRVHGEWFHPGVDLIGFIESLWGDDPYRRVDLPSAYSDAELDRLVAEHRSERARSEAVREARALTIGDERPSAGFWPPPIPGDREAAEIMGRLLAGEPARVSA